MASLHRLPSFLSLARHGSGCSAWRRVPYFPFFPFVFSACYDCVRQVRFALSFQLGLICIRGRPCRVLGNRALGPSTRSWRTIPASTEQLRTGSFPGLPESGGFLIVFSAREIGWRWDPRIIHLGLLNETGFLTTRCFRCSM